jgi:hypothetical protein
MIDHGNHQPYEVTFRSSPRGGQVTWVVYGASMEGVLIHARQAAQRDYPRHTTIKAELAGVPAEATVNGTSRGGRVYRDRFFYHAGPRYGCQSAPIDSVTGLEFHDEVTK